ncbi:MAG: 16S rRNA (uracil(1498)-N(3))-methyltransferase [Pseudomonadota bacterium]
MRLPRIYTNQPLTENLSIELEAAPSRHLARSLRMKPGDHLIVFNGKGGQYAAVVESVQRSTVNVTTNRFDAIERESKLSVTLGITVSRGDRMDWIVQKATELGVSGIVPLISERCEVRLKGDRIEKKLNHWQQIIASACEQCGRNRLPSIQPPLAIEQWINETDASLKLVLHHLAEEAVALKDAPASIALLIGPEGGLTNEEVDAATHANFRAIRLGPRVMRTETAPIAALTIVQSRWGDMTLV